MSHERHWQLGCLLFYSLFRLSTGNIIDPLFEEFMLYRPKIASNVESNYVFMLYISVWGSWV